MFAKKQKKYLHKGCDWLKSWYFIVLVCSRGSTLKADMLPSPWQLSSSPLPSPSPLRQRLHHSPADVLPLTPQPMPRASEGAADAPPTTMGRLVMLDLELKGTDLCHQLSFLLCDSLVTLAPFVLDLNGRHHAAEIERGARQS